AVSGDHAVTDRHGAVDVHTAAAERERLRARRNARGGGVVVDAALLEHERAVDVDPGRDRNCGANAALNSCLVAAHSRTADRGQRRWVLADVDAAADRYVIGIRVAAARELRRVVADDAVLDHERSKAPDPAPARLDAVR